MDTPSGPVLRKGQNFRAIPPYFGYARPSGLRRLLMGFVEFVL